MVDRITRRSEQIGDQPYSGRKIPEFQAENIRELIEKPYRIIYRISSSMHLHKQAKPSTLLTHIAPALIFCMFNA